MRIPHRGEKGFTLIELLVVVIVLGVLAAVAVPIFLSQDENAERVALEVDVSAALELLHSADWLGSTLPSEFPANTFTEVPGVGGIEPAFTLSVFGWGDTLCVQGTTSNGVTISDGITTGVRESECVSFESTPFTYLSTTFVAGENEQTIAPVLDDGLGDPTFTVTSSESASVASAVGVSVASASGMSAASASGMSAANASVVLPPYVKFNSATGQFTGPPKREWRFQGVDIAAGESHTCALTTTGTVKCWGRDSVGQLGDGQVGGGGPETVDVVGLPQGDPVVAVTAGDDHTCTVTKAGAAYCWGSNSDGQLGNGSFTNSPTAVQVVGYGSGVESIVAGGNSTCLVTEANGLACFGNGSSGQLGNGSDNDSSTPVAPTGLNSGVEMVSVGQNHMCAVTTSGGVSCFGAGTQGQLGQGSNTGSNIPVTVKGVSDAVSVAVGNQHSCAVLIDSTVSCWGGNRDGQLGKGSDKGNSKTPSRVANLQGAQSITASGNHTCVKTPGGNVECWGGNRDGQLGGLNAGSKRPTVSLVGGATNVVNVATGKNHTCAITSDKSVQCWGAGNDGQLGYDVTGEPGSIAVPPEPFCDGDAVLDPSTNECVTTVDNPGFYSCPSGGDLDGTSCVTPVWVPPVTTYSCPSGGTLSGTVCNYSFTTYTCPAGSTRSGTTCVTPYTYYTCPSGGTLSGTRCERQSISGYYCDTTGLIGDIIEGPDASNMCRWYAWVCRSGWSKVTGSLCSQQSGPFTSNNTCSSINSSLGTKHGYPKYAGGSWTPASSTTTYSCPSGWTRSGTTCSRTTSSTTSGTLGNTLCSSARSSLCSGGSWSCSNTKPRPWTCTKSTTSSQPATASTTTTPGYCTYYTKDYVYNAVKTFRQGFSATPTYSDTSYDATSNTGYSYSPATPSTSSGSYGATASTTPGYWTSSSYGATWNPPATTDVREPAAWRDATEYLATPTRVLGSGNQPGFPRKLTVVATYPDGKTYSEEITLNIKYPVPGGPPR